MKSGKVAIIGAGGFIGSSLAKYLSAHKFSKSLTLITRAQADHLDFLKLKIAVRKCEIIFHASGLSRQDPGSNTNKVELLVEHIMQNSVSALVISRILNKNQKLIWLSTNAVDNFLNLISSEESERIERMLESILNKIKPGKTSRLQMRLIVLLGLKEYMREFIKLLQKFSYPFSKYLGQRILEKQTGKKIKIIKLSDVFGPGQDISSKVIDPDVPARRIQRFVACYKAINEGNTEWIPVDKPLHGFLINEERIIHYVQNDFVYPTYIDEVCEYLVRASRSSSSETLLDASSGGISNFVIAETIRDSFGADVEVRQDGDDLEKFSEDAEVFKRKLQSWIYK